MATGVRWYLAGAALALGIYIAIAGWFAAAIDFSDEGPLGPGQPAMTEALPSGIDAATVEAICSEDDLRSHVVAAEVGGAGYYACYRYDGDMLYDAKVIYASNGTTVRDVEFLRDVGAWSSIGIVKTRGELLLGGIGTLVILAYGLLYYTALRPAAPTNAPWWAGDRALRVLTWIPLLGWLSIAYWPGVSRARRVRAAMQVSWGVAIFIRPLAACPACSSSTSSTRLRRSVAIRLTRKVGEPSISSCSPLRRIATSVT
jgi:hypothetical protein